MRQMRVEAEGVLGLDLEAPDGSELPAWTPGAHLDVLLPGGGVRQYSLCGDPADLSCYRIGVLHEVAGRGGSRFVHTQLRPGDVLDVRGPRNHFGLVEAESYLFVAGGIGVTPLLPMVEDVARRGRPFHLLYGGRSSASMAFTAALSRHGDRVRLVPQDTDGLPDLAAALGPPRPGVAVYACGPEPLLAAMESAMVGWPPGALHVERFAAPGAPRAAPVGPDTFEVVLARSGSTVTVGPETSVLDAVQAAGADVLSDCREGICSSCETKVLEGDIDHRDHVLTDRERQEGSVMMLCVSRAACPRLVLDL